MEFRVLGPLEVLHDRQLVDVRGAKRRGLLAFLLVRSPAPQPQDVIVEAVWGGAAGPGAPATVQTYVSQLRKLLASDPGVWLDTLPAGYALRMPPDRFDAARFETLIAQGSREPDSQVRLRCLDEALGLWRGVPLGEFDAAWTDSERARLDGLRLRALGLRVDVRLGRGDHAGLVPELESLVREFPLDEGVWARLMVAYHRCGRQADALRAFAEVRKRLATELGIEPGTELVDLERRVLDNDPSLRIPENETAVPVRERADSLPEGVVTFVLTDIEGSTQLWDTDPDGMAAALARHEQLVTEVVRAQHGRLLKSRGEGDATLSVFVRATDAIAAALELQQQLVAHAWPNELSLPTRIALHSGEAQLRDGDYYGGTLNRAARIRNLAAGGEIVCSRATHDLVADALPTDASLIRLGEHELKGLRRRENVYAMSHPDLPSVRRGPRRGSPDPHFVAREREVETFLHAAAEVTSGASRVVLISGEAGIGKTTLVEHVTRHSEFEAFDVLWGRCYEHEGAPPFWPWLQFLRADGGGPPLGALAVVSGDDALVLEQLLPELSNTVHGKRTLPELDRDAARFRLFEVIVRVLRSASAKRPLMLIFDDVHWADQPSLLLLEFAARQLTDTPTLFIATYRTADARARRPVSDTMAELVRAQGTTTLTLRGLDVEEVAHYVEYVSGVAVTPQLAQALHERTDGNAFFLAESVRLLDQSGRLSEDSVGGQVPETIRAAIERRVSRLPESVRRLLDTAAVIGREFDERVLARAADVAPSEAAVLLFDAERSGLVTQVTASPIARHRFVHALVRDAVYDGLRLDRRRDLHGRVGNALSDVHGDDVDDFFEAIAHHFTEAAPSHSPERALVACERAARHALSLYAYENAASLADQALQLSTVTDDPPPEQRCDLLLLLGDALARAGEEPRAQAAYVDALSEARRLRDGDRMTDAVLGLSWNLWFDATRADVAQRTALFEEVLDLLSPGDSRTRARLLATHAEVLYLLDPMEERRLAGEAVAMARRLNDDAALPFALTVLAQASGAGDARRGAAGEELVAVGQRIGDRRVELWGHRWRHAHGLESADGARIRSALDAMRDLAELLAGRERREYLKGLAAHLTLTGNLDEAERVAGEAIAVVQSGDPIGEQEIFVAQIGVIRILQGRLDELVEPLTNVLPTGLVGLTWRCGRAAVLAQTGHMAQAASLLDELAPDDATIQEWPQYANTLFDLAALGLAAHALDDPRRATALHAALRPFEHLVVCVGAGITTIGPVAYYLGLLAACFGRHQDAVAHFDRAIDIASRIGGRPFVAMARAECADVLIGSDAQADVERAAALAADALQDAHELGLRSVEDRARHVLALVEQRRAVAAARARFGAPSDRFVGRGSELAALDDLLSRPGLVTITGTGGIGKTRLALEASALVSPRFERTWFVRLAGLVDDAAVSAALEAGVAPMVPGGAGLNQRSAGSALERTVEAVGASANLIVLDNCEHVRAGVVAAIQPLLGRCPNLTVLATSRERLSVPGERVLLVPPLSLTDLDVDGGDGSERESEAVRLLADRTQAASHDFAVTPENEAVLGQICIALDGIPLALELAAARLASTSPSDLLARMSQQLQFLGGEPTRDDRHRTLEATIGWSYRLLEPREQALLRRLSVFRGGFTLDAVERVCTATVDDLLSAETVVFAALAELVTKSLVAFDREQGRYRLLEPVRVYAKQRLNAAQEAATFSDRHARWVREFARRIMRDQLNEEPEVAGRLVIESDNLEVALAWCERTGDDETMLGVVSDLGFCWFACDWRRGLRLARVVTDRRRPVSDRLWANALLSRGMLEQRERLEASVPFLRECLTLQRDLGSRQGEAWALYWLGKGLMLTTVSECRERLEEAVAIFRELQQPFGVTWTLANLAQVMLLYDEPEAATGALEEAAATAREHNLRAVLGSSLADLGMMEMRAGRVDRALPMLHEAVELLRGTSDRYNLAGVLRHAGYVELMAGHSQQAEALFRETIEVALESDDAWELNYALIGMSEVCLERGDFRRARLMAAASGWDVKIPDPVPWSGGRTMRELRERLPPGLEDAAEEGRRLGAEAVARMLLATPAAASPTED